MILIIQTISTAQQLCWVILQPGNDGNMCCSQEKKS